MVAGITPFRAHFADGSSIDVLAEDAKQARTAAADKRPGAIITKIKVVKESSNGR